MGTMKERRFIGQILAIVAIAMLMPLQTFAGAGVATITQDPKFAVAITLGLGIFAVIKVFDYIASFSTETALKGMLVPAMLLFLTAKWQMLLGWFGLN